MKTPPTQSPATAAAEARTFTLLLIGEHVSLSEKLGHLYRGHPQHHERLNVIELSAYFSTEQELREARRLLQESRTSLSQSYRSLDGNDFYAAYQTLESIEGFLSKPSNLPRE